MVIHATNNFAMKAETVKFYFFIAAGATLFGAALFLANNCYDNRDMNIAKRNETALENQEKEKGKKFISHILDHLLSIHKQH